MTMCQEWMRTGDSTPACWACFLVFEEHVDVLAVIGSLGSTLVSAPAQGSGEPQALLGGFLRADAVS